MFGFDADVQTLLRAESDHTYSSENYGVPLSPAEESEMLRRVGVERAVANAVGFGEDQPTWGGYYIDQLARGQPVFLFTGNETAMTAEIRATMPDTEFRVEHVKRSLADLTDLQAAIHASWDDFRELGIHVTQTSIRVERNTVMVGVNGLTDTVIATITRTFGDGLLFREQAPAVSDVCPATNCRPIKGGITIDGPAAARECTSGFLVRRTLNGGQLAVLTAGHCIEVQNQLINHDWTHSGDVFGDAKHETWFDNSDGDVGLIELKEDEIPAVANRIFLSPDGGPGDVYSVTDNVVDNLQTFGVQACAYGSFSNNSHCGMVTAADVINESVANKAGVGVISHDIKHTKEYNWNLIEGDSGGPIYQVAGSGIRHAMGTHVHSDAGGPGAGTGWYTPYGWGRWAYGQLTGDWYNLCTDANC